MEEQRVIILRGRQMIEDLEKDAKNQKLSMDELVQTVMEKCHDLDLTKNVNWLGLEDELRR